MTYQQQGRVWVEVQKMHLPPVGVLRGWMAIDKGMAIASIFEAIPPPGGGANFMLCYHVFGELRPRIERFNTFEFAQQHANNVLSGAKLIPRSLPGFGGGAQHH